MRAKKHSQSLTLSLGEGYTIRCTCGFTETFPDGEGLMAQQTILWHRVSVHGHGDRRPRRFMQILTRSQERDGA